MSDFDGLVFTEEPPPISRKEYRRRWMLNRNQKIAAEARIIAWDGEGIKLRGSHRPQQYVLFGCSAEPTTPLTITDPNSDLDFVKIADYMLAVSERYPGAKHIGYYFSYDQNMIIKHLPWALKLVLYEKGSVYYRVGSNRYRVQIKFGKQIWLSRHQGKDTPTSRIRVDDMGPFFATSFVKAYQKMFPDHVTDPSWQTVVRGKDDRATTTWQDMSKIRRYWEIEIAALERLATFFRDLMFNAGFPLHEWYGPGALAKKIRQMYHLGEHEWGGKEENIPAGVHHAAKMAYFGGHFERFLTGIITGPIFSFDKRSAYPAAFTHVPTLQRGGFWREVESPSPDPETFGVYHVRYQASYARLKANGAPKRGVHTAQPLPLRSERGEVCYAPLVEGWFWRPEVQLLMDCYPNEYELFSGWEWVPASNLKPWANVLLPMFAKRRELKAAGDPSEMAFKLGPNSLYGKMAQRKGWNRETNKPPPSHTLCIAGYITSHCRADIMRLAKQIPDGQLIAIETDGIYTTCPPERLTFPDGIGDELGQWDIEQYDEMMMIQNGLYLLRRGDEWPKVKTRGINRDQVTPEGMRVFLTRCGRRPKPWPTEHLSRDNQLAVIADFMADQDAYRAWPTIKLSGGERFTGLAAAVSRSLNRDGQIVMPKAAMLHCRWTPDTREVTAGSSGKRGHDPFYCPACKAGLTAADAPHWLITSSDTGMRFSPDGQASEQYEPVSHPYGLPWEKDYVAPAWLARDELANSMITAEDVSDL